LPLYEYRCTACGYSFEKIQSFAAEPESVCPKCQGVLIRPVTAPALQFKGAGWYVNDYAAKGSAKSAEATNAAAAENPTGASSAEVKTSGAPGTSASEGASSSSSEAPAAKPPAPSATPAPAN
jgi:putative FmdB family regulatory protein